ncbi:hypothetical protein GCM10012320_11330 [Sinomonas cellulolyticus]|uniref:Uncharacterized protein n=1 Tax=Sinomonas cellulolyticus TaxID=2801916 RepID=A0ABS1K4J8_9MICC|nr:MULTISPECIES: hypothetical protein [Sinomonas]MBL0706589.1 hypothetical protein [Sinomonas cellulolyticus]GHG45444.1 hypothetical protein GCM10012320_11330 [Sinomonas sp. KCTC 49339]
MVDTLQERPPATSREFDNAYAASSSQHTWRDSVEALIADFRRRNFEASCLVEFAAGTPRELIRKTSARSRGGN